ncbi:M3 family oligoendopeptidase [Aggregatilinea lenta]|uniref:M3 family oligoendopeptidase n=1 Tax=Aggregatilinea lenta TaxID=913108 RepID=UPI000E5ACFC8|nr:M3 family oligoendopeptidase [Aggregatilinea lenta]
MTLTTLPTITEFMDLSWDRIEPFFVELAGRPLDAGSVQGWLADWSRLSELVDETYSRLYFATTQDTTDDAAEARFHAFLEGVFPKAQASDQALKQKLLASGLEPDGFEIPLRNMRAEAALFREANLPLQTAQSKVTSQLNRIFGAQTVDWDGSEMTVLQSEVLLLDPDRAVRERAWRLASDRQLADRDAVNALWVQYMDLRKQIARNAGFDSFRDYRWQQLLRFSYTPDDCTTFHNAIEEVVVPAARRIYERKRALLGVETLRPWDVEVDPTASAPIVPYKDVAELEDKGQAIFDRVDPALGAYFATMRRDGLLDLDNRKGKGPGAYSTSFEASKRPIIFMNAVGSRADIRTLLHEAGHAFHAFEAWTQPLYHQRVVPMEFAEVASMSMELLAAPYLPASEGGFFAPEDAARDRIAHLEKIVKFWPYMAVVDAYQHWVYENIDAARDPEQCDATWSALWDRFMPGIDYSGLEADKANGWHRKRHIHRSPFYYVEYGMAQLGAVLVWKNALRDQAEAVRQYRHALSLAGTVDLPDLYRAAGVRFAFDAAGLREAVDLLEGTLKDLYAQV